VVTDRLVGTALLMAAELRRLIVEAASTGKEPVRDG
jgi:hypothetical protein